MANETCKQFVERIWGPCTEKQRDGLLWGCTAFPAADIDHIEKQLLDIKDRSGGDYAKAMKIADDEITEAMKGATDGKEAGNASSEA